MTQTEARVTRGTGLLEKFLAVQRGRQADRLIPDNARAGRILDVGCGSFPLFLSRTRFAERYGVDRAVSGSLAGSSIHLVDHDVATVRRLPFADDFFSAVTMLAVFEHLDDSVLLDLVREIKRVLARGGVLVLTTPASWTVGILQTMSRLGLVSHDEIDEHKRQYSRAGIVDVLTSGGFAKDQIEVGSFELGMNLWARARSQG